MPEIPAVLLDLKLHLIEALREGFSLVLHLHQS